MERSEFKPFVKGALERDKTIAAAPTQSWTLWSPMCRRWAKPNALQTTRQSEWAARPNVWGKRPAVGGST
jgi:hypothetical protein